MEVMGQIRQDGLTNALTGIGGIQDRTRATVYTQSTFRPDEEWTSIWTSNGLGRKICSLRPDDMIRQWIEVPDDPENKLIQELDKLNVRRLVLEALYWTRLYGGALIVKILKDGASDLSQPLADYKQTAPLDRLLVYPATRKRINSNYTDVVTDPKSKYFGEIETYNICPPDSSSTFLAHASRCFVSKGAPVPPDEGIEWRYRYWGASALQSLFDAMGDHDTVHNAFANLIHQATIGKLKLQGLSEIVADDDTATQRLRGTMDNVARSISYLNMILLGEGDEFTRDQLSLAGWKEVSQIFKERLASESGYSTSVLFETAASSGLSASSSEDQATQRYYNSVQVDQETELRPILQSIINHVAPMVGLDPEIPWKFKNLHEPTAKEVADIRYQHAQADKIYLDSGVLFPQEVRGRFEGGNYSDDVPLDESYSAKGPDEIDAEKALETALKAQASANQVVQAPTAQKPIQMPTPPKGKAKSPTDPKGSKKGLAL